MERAEFELLRERQVEKIQENLLEAAELLSKLNMNLDVWGKLSGESEKLLQVWTHFQNQLLVLSQAFMNPK